MIKDKIIIIPIENAWNHSADFLRQTALTLSKNNLVYIYDQNNHYFFLKKHRKQKHPKLKKVFFHQVKYFIPFESFSFINKINRILSFKLFLMKHSNKNKILWIFYPNYYDLAKLKDKKTTTLYDCVDYQEDQKKENLLINHVDYFFVNSLSLKKLHKQKSKKAIYINSQGFFQPDDKKIKNISLKINKPVIGYIGGINCRLDYPLLNKLIKNHQEWQFVFYGPEQENEQKDKIYQTKKWIKKLKKYKNTTFACKEDRHYIYGLIKNFDIAIIPYNISLPFNKYCYPMKVFEYLYMGKPIVSSDILELRTLKFKKFIKIANDYGDWEKAINNLLEKKIIKKKNKELHQLAITNSWQNKINKMSKFIDIIV